jgi:hypothetical protein
LRRTGGEGGTLRQLGTIRPFSWKSSKSGGLEGYIADYKVDYISKAQSGPRFNADYVVWTVCLRKTCVRIVVNPASVTILQRDLRDRQLEPTLFVGPLRLPEA